MAGVGALPGHAPTADPGVDALKRAFQALPSEAQTYVIDRLAAAWMHYDRTGDIAPLRHLTDSLSTTAQLGDNEHLQQAFAEGDADDSRRGEGERRPGVSVSDFVKRMKVKYGS